MSNQGDDTKAARDAADTNAGLYIRCLRHIQSMGRHMARGGTLDASSLATFVSGEINREREACANVADDWAPEGHHVATGIARDIRNRGI